MHFKRKMGKRICFAILFTMAIAMIINSIIISNSNSKSPLQNHESNTQPIKISEWGKIEWNVTWGDSDTEYFFDLAIDNNESIYCVSHTYQPWDLVLVKYHSNGTKIWERSWDYSGDAGRGVTVDKTGNIYCLGSWYKGGEGSSQDAALIKFNSSGSEVWERIWDGGNGDEGISVVIDANGSIICGIQSYSGQNKIAVVKYYPNGTKVWEARWGAGAQEHLMDIAVDTMGAIYCIGQRQLVSERNSDFFIVKFLPNGMLEWNITWGGSGNDVGRGIAVDSNGAIYCAGSSDSYGLGSSDLILVKFYPNATEAWHKTWGGYDYDEGMDLTLAADGSIFFLGQTKSFGAISEDFVLVKFNPNGTAMWDLTWGGSSADLSQRVAIGPSGNVYCAGYTLSFGAGNFDGVLVKVQINSTLDKPLILPAPTLYPITPALDDDGIVELSWMNVSRATKYIVYRDTASISSVQGAEPIATISTNIYQDRITCNSTYYYAVVAGNSTANSPLSNCENVTVIITRPPPNPPTLDPIFPNYFNPFIDLTWTNVTGATKYYVYRSITYITSVINLVPIAAVSQCGYEDLIYSGAYYFYVIIASNSEVNSSISNCKGVWAFEMPFLWIAFPDFQSPNAIRQDEPLIIEFYLTRKIDYTLNITITIQGENFQDYCQSFIVQNESIFVHIELLYYRSNLFDQGRKWVPVDILINDSLYMCWLVVVTVEFSLDSILVLSSFITIGGVAGSTMTQQIIKRRGGRKEILNFINDSKSPQISLQVLSSMTHLDRQSTSKLLTNLIRNKEIKGSLKEDTFYQIRKKNSAKGFQKKEEGWGDLEESINERIQFVNRSLESLESAFRRGDINRGTFELVKAELLSERRKLKQELILWNKDLTILPKEIHKEISDLPIFKDEKLSFLKEIALFSPEDALNMLNEYKLFLKSNDSNKSLN